jgi:ribonuclease E
VDINSARATKGSDIEETALNTNLEAADEVARQLRLRDMGGLFVIDFIDMTPTRNQREVENRLKEAMKQDRARVQIGRISRFGLLEMSRQRLRPSLGESSQHICPRCNGHGFIRGVESLALSVLRIVEEEAMKENTARLIAHLPVDVATFLLNEKRQAIYDIERRQSVDVVLVPNINLETPNYNIERIRAQDLPQQGTESSSYELVDRPELEAPEYARPSEVQAEEPAVKRIKPVAPAPTPAPKQEETSPEQKAGFISRFINGLFSVDKKEEEIKSAETVKPEAKKGQSRNQPRKGRQRQPEGRGKREGEERSSQRQQKQKSASGNRPKKQGPKGKQEKERKETTEAQKTQTTTSAEAPADTTRGEEPDRKSGSSRRRGRRGGRRRRSSAQKDNMEAANGNATEQTTASKPADSQQKRPQKEPKPEHSPDRPEQPPKPTAKPSPTAAVRNAPNDSAQENREAVKVESDSPESSQAKAKESGQKAATTSIDSSPPATRQEPPAAKATGIKPASAPAKDAGQKPAVAEERASSIPRQETPTPSPAKPAAPEQKPTPMETKAPESRQRISSREEKTEPSPAPKREALDSAASRGRPARNEQPTNRPTTVQERGQTVGSAPKKETPSPSKPANTPENREQRPKLQQVETKPVAEKPTKAAETPASKPVPSVPDSPPASGKEN